jgi:hypothetical protein
VGISFYRYRKLSLVNIVGKLSLVNLVCRYCMWVSDSYEGLSGSR